MHNRVEWLVRQARMIPSAVWHIAALVIASRVVVTLAAVLARFLFSDANNISPYWPLSPNMFLAVWGQWDTYWYVELTANGYTTLVHYCYFPLYPGISWILNLLVNDPFISGLIVANISLVIACVYLYKIMRLDDDEATALRAVKYLIVWPTAFILGAVYTESLFLALMVAAFYYARKGNWLATGILAGLSAVTRNLGIFAIVPLAYIYMEKKNWQPRAVRADVLWLLMIPLIYSFWLAFNFINTGSPFTFATQQAIFGRGWYSIWNVLIVGALADFPHFVWAMTVIICLAVLTVGHNRIGPALWLYGIIAIAIPTSTGLMATLRFTCVIFPLFIICARAGKNSRIDAVLTVCLAMLQGLLLVFWYHSIMT